MLHKDSIVPDETVLAPTTRLVDSLEVAGGVVVTCRMATVEQEQRRHDIV